MTEGGGGGRRNGGNQEPPGREAAKTESAGRDSRRANFLELFFDLVLVFALSGVVSRVVPAVRAP